MEGNGFNDSSEHHENLCNDGDNIAQSSSSNSIMDPIINNEPNNENINFVEEKLTEWDLTEYIDDFKRRFLLLFLISAYMLIC